MPGPQVEWRDIGDLYVESTPLSLKIDDIELTRRQAFELRDFLMQQFPGEKPDSEEDWQRRSREERVFAPNLGWERWVMSGRDFLVGPAGMDCLERTPSGYVWADVVEVRELGRQAAVKLDAT